ncbi:hypothetical protein C8R42DRAFT_620753 [Lentinula raphanica]|nr:hypothetical protein C8R42DRAFT_620753 [Lentinula raphanica]
MTRKAKKSRTGDAGMKGKRGPRKSASERREELENDEFVSAVLSERDVRCVGCGSNIRLGKPYELKNWTKHRGLCPRITLKKRVRTQVKQETPVIPSSSGLHNYFRKASDGTATTSDIALVTSNAADVTSKSEPVTAKVHYMTKEVAAEPSIKAMFMKTDSGPAAVSRFPTKTKRPCVHLKGTKYTDYIDLTRTRNLGGISALQFGLLARRQFPYKEFPKLKSEAELPQSDGERPPVPSEGSLSSDVTKWTESEWARMKHLLSSYARWEVNFQSRFIKSTQCEQQTLNPDGVCDKCRSVGDDESLKRAVRKKRHEAQLPQEERLQKALLREKHASLTTDRLQKVQRRFVNDILSDKILFDVTESLKTGDAHDCFLRLWEHAKAGNLNEHQRVVDICDALDDRVTRELSGNPRSICGIRYSQNVINFMMMMRSYGHNSHQQYSLFTSVFGGPSSRHLQTLRAKSVDAMQNPYLIFENVARFKRYYDSCVYSGPVIAGSDCTKVKKRLNFSVQFGRHILGSTMPLEMVEVDCAEDIDEIVDQIVSENTLATQVRAVMMKIPIPQCPPVVVALLPTCGKESAEDIHQMHMRLVAMSEQLELPLIALVADGAATELSAQSLMDDENTGRPPLLYENQAYGLRLSAPVFKTGPLISVTDAPHARKTARNQPQHGTHTASLGSGFLVNRSLVEIYMLEGAGLMLRDVDNVDKQDDGAARRIFHSNVLHSMRHVHPGSESPGIKPDFEGPFVYLFVLGLLFEAWMSPAMALEDRILAAFRARFWLNFVYHHISYLSKRFPDLYSSKRSFISAASLRIFNRLCDTLILLVIAYSEYYPDVPFSIRNISTEFIEHFFGVGRELLPDFTYAEFLKIVQHIMVRQRIVESGSVASGKHLKDSASGYIFDAVTDLRAPSHEPIPPISITRAKIDELVHTAYLEAAHLCRDILAIPASKTPSFSKQPLLHLKAHAFECTSSGDDGQSNEDSDSEDDDDYPAIGDDADEVEHCLVVAENDDDSDDSVRDQINRTMGLSAKDTARYSALCDDLNTFISHNGLSNTDIDLPRSTTVVPGIVQPLIDHTVTINFSKLIDAKTSKISIAACLEARQVSQSATSTKSERSVKLSDKFALKQVLENVKDPNEIQKMTQQEGSHRVRIAQDQNVELQRQQKIKKRQDRWLETVTTINKSLESVDALPNLGIKNVTVLYPLVPHTFVLMKTSMRMYIGQVLDIYKKGQSSRYGSVNKATEISGLSFLSLRVFLPLVTASDDGDTSGSGSGSDTDEEDAPIPHFSCLGSGRKRFHLHTHAPIADVLYHLGKDALSGPLDKMQLNERCAQKWSLFQKREIRAALKASAPLKIIIPARRREE